jgi:hypothetical protein
VALRPAFARREYFLG